MNDFVLSEHAKDMIGERNIREEWIWRVIETPDHKRMNFEDGNIHYTKSIRERGGNVLRVVVNSNRQPNRIVTVFFDRRLRK